MSKTLSEASFRAISDFFHQHSGIRLEASKRHLVVSLVKVGYSIGQHERLNIAHYFQARCHIELVTQGKPAPDIYLLAAAKLGVAPQHCLVFEDSFAGVSAAKAAGMTVVAIPAEHEWQHSKFELADHKIRCFSQFDLQQFVNSRE